MTPVIHCFLNNFARIIIGGLICSSVLAAEPTTVITSIKPLALVAQELLSGTSIKVDYLLPPTISEHGYALKISDVKKLQRARLVVWLGRDLEPYLSSTENTWMDVSQRDKSLALLSKLNISQLHTSGDHNLGDHKEHSIDPHIWLSPDLTLQIAEQLETRMVILFPQQAALIEANLVEFKQKLVELDLATKKTLEPYKDTPFLVYHSAYGYYIAHYDLHQIGALHIQPGATLSLKQLAGLQQVLDKQTKAVCLFREPQFEALPVPEFKTKQKLNMGTLDPLGINATTYIHLMENLTTGLVECFIKG